MPFLMGSLLFGLLAMSIPIIIHLLHRQRTQPIQWGAMQFLLESPLQLKRRKKVDHWLLMLLRIAVVGILALLLARPLLIDGKYNPLSSNIATDIAVVVDRSVSTGRTNGKSSVFDQGINVVDEVAKNMRPNDTLTVVLAEHRPNTSMTPLPVRRGGVPEIQKKLHELKPGLTDASIPDSVQAAREQIARGPNTQKMVLVVSDDQRNGWKIENNSAWRAALGERIKGDDRNVKMYSVPITPDTSKATDIAIGDLAIQPSLVGVKQRASITATVNNTGGEDFGAFNVRLTVGGKLIESRPIAGLKAGTSQTLRFEHVFNDAGSSYVTLEADAKDALAADNKVDGSAYVFDKVKVLVIDGQLTDAGEFKSSRYLTSAMQPVPDPTMDTIETAQVGVLRPKVVSVAAADGEKLDDYAVTVVNDAPSMSSEMLTKLFNYARTGHGVWFILGARTDQALLGKQLAMAGLFTVDLKEQKNVKDPPGVDIKVPTNPTVALLTAAERNSLTGAITKQWWSITPKDGDGQTILANTSGDPLVVERPIGAGGGRVVVWATSVDGAWNNWPVMPNFVPLVNETIYHLASGTTQAFQHQHLEAGMPIEWSGPATPTVKVAKITRPDGKVVERKAALNNGRQRITFHDTGDPGLYAVRFDPTEIPQPIYYGLGLDRKELDTTPLTDSDFSWLSDRGYMERKVASADVGGVLGGVNKGNELWPYLGIVVLALLVFETVMTWRMADRQKKVDVAAAGLAQAHAPMA